MDEGMKDFLFTLLAWLLTLPFIIGAVAFAIYNPQVSDFTLNPFKAATPLPVYVPVLSAVAFGFLFGAIMTWAAMGRLRKERSDQRKRIKALEKQLDAVNRAPIPNTDYTLIPSSFTNKK